MAGTTTQNREVQAPREAAAPKHDGSERTPVREQVGAALATPSPENKTRAELPSNQTAKDSLPSMQIVSGDRPLTGSQEQAKPAEGGRTPYAVPKMAPEDKKYTEEKVQRAGQSMAYDIAHEGDMGKKGSIQDMAHGDQLHDASMQRISGLLNEAEDRGGPKAVEDMSKRINGAFQKAQKDDKADFPNGPEKEFKMTGQTLTRADIQIYDKKTPTEHSDTSIRLNQ